VEAAPAGSASILRSGWDGAGLAVAGRCG
jgi:hypothetical protein